MNRYDKKRNYGSTELRKRGLHGYMYTIISAILWICVLVDREMGIYLDYLERHALNRACQVKCGHLPRYAISDVSFNFASTNTNQANN
jgi:hypothetical protein